MLVVSTFTLDDGSRQGYSLALSDSPLRLALPGDGTWGALAVAMVEARTIAALPRSDDEAATPVAALVCRPTGALLELAPDGPGAERPLGADQSHTSVMIGDELLLKAFRRLQPGLNPDLEMTAFLSEDAGFPAVPRLAGFAEVVSSRTGTTTVAMLQEFVPDAADAFESVADALAAWLLAPGDVNLEQATEIAADLGTLTAGMHAAVGDAHGVPGMGPRPATRQEVRGWAAAAHEHLSAALESAVGEAGQVVRDLAPRIAESITVIDALPTAPEVVRAHGDYHLGQVLIAPDGFRVIDFEGEPLGTTEERRAHRPALRDVASMLRSLDHAARSARRRAEARHGGPLERTGLDLDDWLRRARDRFLVAYTAGLLERRIVPDIDPDLLHAFEVDKELYEFAYAATYLPSWLYAPTEGMLALFDGES